MEILLLGKNYAVHYKEMRLKALQLHPEAFASSYQEEEALPISTFENRLSSTSSYTFGAIEHQQLYGAVTLLPEEKNKLKHRGNIVAMYVSEEKRGAGLGRKLMQAAIQQAGELKCIEQLHLTVMAKNESAKKLYRSLGFQSYAVEKNALKVNGQYYDEELMVLYISNGES
ncbi:GNAT family N-acetyltransferase [Metabacillus lacus]